MPGGDCGTSPTIRQYPSRKQGLLQHDQSSSLLAAGSGTGGGRWGIQVQGGLQEGQDCEHCHHFEGHRLCQLSHVYIEEVMVLISIAKIGTIKLAEECGSRLWSVTVQLNVHDFPPYIQQICLIIVARKKGSGHVDVWPTSSGTTSSRLLLLGPRTESVYCRFMQCFFYKICHDEW
ncbi:hypothetical protein CEXT_258591 [Caerostris extrusa]|uniref:Uncharacterized protein n=1 Tax=Caerostris extrusa TaxID=172846 RepID=A0AAV4M314_CAEEX|nr:hypothetical protein CEXT_258591 [Caerostris extrusa]